MVHGRRRKLGIFRPHDSNEFGGTVLVLVSMGDCDPVDMARGRGPRRCCVF